MLKNKSYLNYLIGEAINDVSVDVSTFSQLTKAAEDESTTVMSVNTQILFNQYRLDIYNKMEIIGRINVHIKDLVGLRVIDINETNEMAELFFDNGFKLVIDLINEAGTIDPETMCLQGPDNLIVVWD